MKNRILHLTASLLLLLAVQIGVCQTTGLYPANCMLLASGTVVSDVATNAANGQCTAFIDNKSFLLADLKPVTVTVHEPAADGTAKTEVDITIAGKDQETIKLGLALTEPLSPGATGFRASLSYQGVAYTLVKGDGREAEITDFIWSRDRKSFMISLSFNCNMHSTEPTQPGNHVAVQQEHHDSCAVGCDDALKYGT